MNLQPFARAAIVLAALAASARPPTVMAGAAARTELAVPNVKQARERCGPAALAMVLRYYGAGAAAVREADRAYDPVLRGALITDLAAAARRAGFEAEIATLTPDSLVVALDAGVPPIVLYQAGLEPLTMAHFGVVTGWDASRGTFTLNAGEARPRVIRREEYARRWRTAGSQALLVRRRSP
jgi:ABC-type bacteriocin/lantibiotic exporter with double-glycine peptidase domain